MPYVSKQRRYELEAPGEIPNHPGDLNYKVTLEVLRFLGDKPNYERYNAAIGALECCKLELYRRMVAPYEDHKIDDNGDVYPQCTTCTEEESNEKPNPARDLARKLHDQFMKSGQYVGAR